MVTKEQSILNSSKLPNLTYIPNIQDLKTLYAELNLLFSPSLHEGLPYVVLEAICNYIPVVLSPIPPFTDLYKRYKSPLINFPIACNDHYPSVHDYVDCIESVLSASRYDMACDLNSTNLISHFSSSKRWSDMYIIRISHVNDELKSSSFSIFPISILAVLKNLSITHSFYIPFISSNLDF